MHIFPSEIDGGVWGVGDNGMFARGDEGGVDG